VGRSSSSAGGPCGVTAERSNSVHLMVGSGLTVVSSCSGCKSDYLLEDVETERDLDCVLPNGRSGCGSSVLQCMLDQRWYSPVLSNGRAKHRNSQVALFSVERSMFQSGGYRWRFDDAGRGSVNWTYQAR